ncbi:MAG: creatininase family protein [Gemmatimonadota bacterium]
MARPYVLAETTWKQVRETPYELAVLPWGATEAHNYHLPYGTDVYQAEAVAIEAARIAWDVGARVVVLPTLPFGVNTGQLDIPLTINMNPGTQLAMLADIAESLDTQGIPRLVILNGHGGNDFKAMIRELQPRRDLLIATVNWYSVLKASEYFDEPGDHGGELETSVMLHLHADLVSPLGEAGAGAVRSFSVTAFREGWAWTPRAWLRATSDTGAGDPARATAAKGARYFTDLTGKVASFLSELARTPNERLYQGE